MAWRRSISSPVLWAAWLATRTALYLHATVPGRDGDVGLYQRWYACCFAHGTFPVADPMWQYPPGAALLFWLPGRLPGSYVEEFMFLAVGCDLAITLMLWSSAGRGGSLAGAWYWASGMPLKARSASAGSMWSRWRFPSPPCAWPAGPDIQPILSQHPTRRTSWCR